MSCDSRRREFFAHPPECVSALIGAPEAAGTFLEALFDLTRQQPVPEGMADRLAAAAATQKVKARAARQGINLYPHESKSGLPRIDVQFGWKAISDVLDAAEEGAPLPPLAADLQRSAAYQCVATNPPWLWETPLIPANRQQMRLAWAGSPDRIAALVTDSKALSGDEDRLWLRGLTEIMAADRAAIPALVSAAQHYLLLDEEDMLAPRDRTRWAHALASLAGVGLYAPGRRGRVGLYLCPQCGLWGSIDHPCIPGVTALKGDAAVVAARGLIDPEHADVASDQSPVGELERQTERWLRDGREPPPGSDAALALATLRGVDRAWVAGLSKPGEVPRTLPQPERQRLRDATLRTPVIFAGMRCIWDAGRLFEERIYRERADWDLRGDSGEMLPPSWRDIPALAHIDGPQMAVMLAGRQVPLRTVRVDPTEAPHLFDTSPVSMASIRKGDQQVEPCGCIYRCTEVEQPSGMIRFERVRQCGGAGCAHNTYRAYSRHVPGVLTCVSPDRPRYGLPRWPDPAEGGA